MFNLDKSPILNLSKKGLKRAGLLATIVLASTSISTGVIPVTVAGFSNQGVANAQSISGTLDLGSTFGNA